VLVAVLVMDRSSSLAEIVGPINLPPTSAT
jgi:hypothetical protein